MNHFKTLCCWAAVCLCVARQLAAQDPFAAGVRPTDPLSPQDEQKALQVPDGFEVQLVAAEPDILKPMNMAFDERGRMWITNSVEYPWAAPLDKPGRDSVKILHDTDGDGRADVIKSFADGLNIPIGVYPYPSRKDEVTGKTIQGAIVWSIPYIWDLRDTDGDDICDERTKLYGPFGYERDTHGMCNAFRRGFDGWIYACHGFNNISKVAGKDGHVVEMHSGNTFRFRMDGSRIEHFTHGQVNPFGMCFDPLFNIFTADCHTKPVTQLLRGGYYQSFGKPHDGLGFVPEIMSHTHGTTANCGIVMYYGGHFPPEWQGKFFTGNVMTSRVNVDAPEYHGSTILAKEEPDFVISDDPWFRPVDLQCGPDGALYIADFYNKIIGHYEVDLKHPGRDRFRGRIWRVIHKATPLHRMPDLRTQSTDERVVLLGHENLTVRLLTMNTICDSTVPPSKQYSVLSQSVLSTQKSDPTSTPTPRTAEVAVSDRLAGLIHSSKSPFDRCHAMWIIERLNASPSLVMEFAKDPSREVRVHTMKIFSERAKWIGGRTFAHSELSEVVDRLRLDDDAFVKRAAADALAGHPDDGSFWLAASHAADKAPAADHHLTHVLRLSLRSLLSAPGQLRKLTGTLTESAFRDEDAVRAANVARAIPSEDSADFLLAYITSRNDKSVASIEVVHHIARYVSPLKIPDLVRFVRANFNAEHSQQLEFLSVLRKGIEQRGDTPDDTVRDWAGELAAKLLESSGGASLSWANEVVPGKSRAVDPWVPRARVSQDGDKESLFFDSLVKGEQLTGLYRSEPFELPAKLSFWCAGHNGLPGAPFNPKNYIRLRDASTHALLREAMPPRNDTAQKIEWDLSEFVGQPFQAVPKASQNAESKKSQPGKADLRRGYIEILDADEAGGYAWLAVGRFSAEALNPSRVVDQQIAAANLIADFRISNLKSQISDRLISRDSDARAKEAFARAVLTLEPDAILLALAPLIADVSLPAVLRDDLVEAVARGRRPDARVRSDSKPSTTDAANRPDVGVRSTETLLLTAVKAIPERLQLRLAESLASDATGAEALLRLAKDGHVSPRLLTRPTVKQRLEALKSEAFSKQIAELTKELPDENAALQKLIEQRRGLFLTAQSHSDAAQRPSLEAGAALFTKHCAACHQIAGKGTIVGPQLDGIGQRGLERVLEDVLDANRNVDVNFRTTTVVTKEGKIFSGLIRREEGATLVLVDNKGKEFTVLLADIDEQAKSNLSLMPANVNEVLTEREFLDLVSYLLSQRQKSEAKGE